jgi:UDP-glucose 4-epimerase
MRILVTGGAGFIGSHLVEALLRAPQNEVVVLDTFLTGKTANLADVAKDPRLTVLEGSVADGAAVRRAIERCSLVFHLAAAIGVRYVVDEPIQGITTNVRGTEEVLSAALEQQARVVIASSSEVYGKSTGGANWKPFREDADSVIGPTSVTRWWYSLAKGLDEHLALAYHRQYGLPVSVVRYFNVYGPRHDPGGYGVVARFVTQALRGQPLTVFGDGSQTRSFTYVSDAVEATVRAAFYGQAIGEVFNVGSNQETSILSVAELIRSVAKSHSPIAYESPEAVYGPHFEDTRRRVPDVEKARRLLDFAALVDLDEGVQRTIDWWLPRIHILRHGA